MSIRPPAAAIVMQFFVTKWKEALKQSALVICYKKKRLKFDNEEETFNQNMAGIMRSEDFS